MGERAEVRVKRRRQALHKLSGGRFHFSGGGTCLAGYARAWTISPDNNRGSPSEPI
jgi:hypothetical protein